MSQVHPLFPPYKIIVARPPNFDAIVRVFPVAASTKGVTYAYDDAVYNPDGVKIPTSILEHEVVHLQRQAGKPDVWWERYLADKRFRFDEEVVAHQAEYRAAIIGLVVGHGAARSRRAHLEAIADRLSGPLYGHAVSFEKAKVLIRRGALDGARP